MSPEQKAAWLSARCGLLTASRMCDVVAVGKKGQPLAERTNYMMELLEERLTGKNVRHVVTLAMEHGQEYENEAVDMYVELTGKDVRMSRFYEHPTIEYFGATPDRELEDGLIEVKCPSTRKFLEWRMAGVVPEEHKPQMLAQMACSGRKWCGFIAYDPRLKDERLRLFLRKYVPTPEEIMAIEDAAEAFLAEVDALFERVTTAAA